MLTSRLRRRRREELDDAGRSLRDRVVARHGNRVIAEDGGLHGPFNAYVTAPHIASGAGRFETKLDPRITEIAILTTAAHWRAEFEWFARIDGARRGHRAGCDPSHLGGRRPSVRRRW